MNFNLSEFHVIYLVYSIFLLMKNQRQVACILKKTCSLYPLYGVNTEVYVCDCVRAEFPQPLIKFSF